MSPMKPQPSPTEIRAARKQYRLTQTEAGALVQAALRTWQDWEAGYHPMHPGLWELFQIKTARRIKYSAP